MDTSKLPLIVAAVAAIPPLLTLLINVIRDAYLISARARNLDEARRLTDFVKSYADAVVAVSNQNISHDVRDRLNEMLLAAMPRGDAAADAIRRRDATPRIAMASMRRLLFPPWPTSRMARYLTFMYYYTLSAAGLNVVFSNYLYEEIFAVSPAVPSKYAFLVIGGVGPMLIAGFMRFYLLQHDRRTARPLASAS